MRQLNNAAFPPSRRGTLSAQKHYCLIVKLNNITSTIVNSFISHLLHLTILSCFVKPYTCIVILTDVLHVMQNY